MAALEDADNDQPGKMETHRARSPGRECFRDDLCHWILASEALAKSLDLETMGQLLSGLEE